MIEQIIEKRICDKFAEALAAAGVDGVQILGAWQSPDDGRKGLEEGLSRGYLSVKVSPRAFDSFTMSDGSLAVRLELNVRAEQDTRGVDYLAITDALTRVVYLWHRSYDVGRADFSTDDFFYTGFRLDGGDCGMDRDRCVWTWIQTLTVQGVFKD